MSEKAQRIGIILVSLVVLASAALVAAYPLLDKSSQNNETTQAELEQQLNNQNQTEEGKLKGTQLQNFTPIESVTELQKITLTPGSGEAVVKETDTVTVNYTGALAKTGVIFESSLDSGQPATFPLSGVIKGWTQGLPGMKVGETRRLIIPSALAYGEAGAGTSIPANSDLVFDVTLIKIGE